MLNGIPLEDQTLCDRLPSRLSREASVGQRPAAPVIMDYDVLEARHVRDYVVWLKFRDDFAPEFLHDSVKVTA